MRSALTAIIGASLALPAFAAEGYVIGEGDTISIEVYREPDLSLKLQVDESCLARMSLVDKPFRVCGRTARELAADIEGVLAGDILIEPHVSVAIETYASQRVEVLGQVHKRGPQFLSGQTTLQEVIDRAGGPNATNVVEVEHYVESSGDSKTYDLSRTDLLAGVMVADGDRVILKEGRNVYVEGEVRKPGQVPFREGLTVTQALTAVGGPNDYAGLRRVVVIRSDGSRETVNLLKVNQGRQPNVALGPDDRLLIRRAAF